MTSDAIGLMPVESLSFGEQETKQFANPSHFFIVKYHYSQTSFKIADK